MLASTAAAGSASKFRRYNYPVPALLVPLLPVTTIGVSALSVGAAVGALIAPLGIRALARYRGIKIIATLWIACLAAGPIIAWITADEISRSLNQRLEFRLLLIFLNAGIS